uniref:Uncharacterized protein n=1 Tax=Nelumbo nucifera TaxID=4432 RepID=A0A822ZHQ7_NELNU|nr:TPA_asm: hypothetical protein HUJ06_001205 [Nelumbo nucifera]
MSRVCCDQLRMHVLISLRISESSPSDSCEAFKSNLQMREGYHHIKDYFWNSTYARSDNKDCQKMKFLSNATERKINPVSKPRIKNRAVAVMKSESQQTAKP